MEPFLADLLNSNKVPKPIRYGVLWLLIGFLVYVGVGVGLNSPMLWGRIFGFALAAAMLALGVYQTRRIHRSKKED